MKIIDRIFQYIDYKGVKPRPFEQETGLSNGYLAKQKARNADLGESIILKIIENCPEINPYWLWMGKGEMLKTKSEENIKEKNININFNENFNKPKVKNTLKNENEEAYILQKEVQDLKERLQDSKDHITTLKEQVKDLREQRDKWEHQYNLAQSEIRKLKNVQDTGHSQTLVG